MILTPREFTSATGDRMRRVRSGFPGTVLRSTRGERGIALPVALLALVAVSILVTSLLLSSATEVSLSAAHQDATRGLFTAEGAIEAYVAQNGANLMATSPAGVAFIPPGGTSRDEVTIRVEVLGNVPKQSGPFVGNALYNDTTYAITAEPRRGGRQVVAMIDKVMEKFTVMIDAGLVSGDNVLVSGNAKLSDGSDSPLGEDGKAICADTVGGKAVQTTANADTAKIIGGNGTILGENEKLNVPVVDIVKNTFGKTLEELIDGAQIKLNARDFADRTVGQVNSLREVGRTPPLDPLNWGCPADIFVGCENDTDLTRMPIIAINAANAASCQIVKKVETCSPGDWGTATVSMSHGQGILIVYNGNFKIEGQFAFKGVILVQGTFEISGKGSDDPQNSPKVEGAVIGLGLNAQGQQSTVTDVQASGNSTVRYNRCAINLVTQQVQQNTPIRRMEGRTFGWFEVVR